MKAPVCAATLLLATICRSQEIVLKSTFPKPANYPYEFTLGMAPYPNIDTTDDGIQEVPVRGNGCFYLDLTTMQVSRNLRYNSWNFDYPQGDYATYVARIRRDGIAEFVEYFSSQYWDPELIGVSIYDIWTGVQLLACPSCTGVVIADYDQDGMDDVIVSNGPNLQVYGIATGNPVSPPQDLNIQITGDDYVITWNSVPSATAYRVLWSSSIDGISFTRIGYTTGTTFTHRSRASEPMGFYRVMSEDNGTGVVRMVGQTTKGER